MSAGPGISADIEDELWDGEVYVGVRGVRTSTMARRSSSSINSGLCDMCGFLDPACRTRARTRTRTRRVAHGRVRRISRDAGCQVGAGRGLDSEGGEGRRRDGTGWARLTGARTAAPLPTRAAFGPGPEVSCDSEATGRRDKGGKTLARVQRLGRLPLT
jgi:hypothetical protein